MNFDLLLLSDAVDILFRDTAKTRYTTFFFSFSLKLEIEVLGLKRTHTRLGQQSFRHVACQPHYRLQRNIRKFKLLNTSSKNFIPYHY